MLLSTATLWDRRGWMDGSETDGRSCDSAGDALDEDEAQREEGEELQGERRTSETLLSIPRFYRAGNDPSFCVNHTKTKRRIFLFLLFFFNCLLLPLKCFSKF